VPKHVALPLTVKNLTGSKEVVTLLNRYGHGISYDQVLQIETTLAEEQLKSNGVVVPKTIKPNVFSTFCWDNIDILEEPYQVKVQRTAQMASSYRDRSLGVNHRHLSE